MAINRKQAPRREVLEIERVGEWGEVTYRHRLSCGHTDVRKRPAPAPAIACVVCQVEKDRPKAARSMPVLPQVEFDDVDVLASAEADAARVRAGLAARFAVSNDAIDVVVDSGGNVSYVVVFLDAATALRLA